MTTKLIYSAPLKLRPYGAIYESVYYYYYYIVFRLPFSKFMDPPLALTTDTGQLELHGYIIIIIYLIILLHQLAASDTEKAQCIKHRQTHINLKTHKTRKT